MKTITVQKSTGEKFRFRPSNFHAVHNIDLDKNGLNDFLEYGRETVKEKLQEKLCQNCPNRLR